MKAFFTKEKFNRDAYLLFFCGAAMLFWELLLIRWLGTSVRIVAYFSNFVLIAAFFGLGVGALLARFSFQLKHFIFPLLSITVLIGIFFSGFEHSNPGAWNEYIWIGSPNGVLNTQNDTSSWLGELSYMDILSSVYVLTAGVFIIFGQWIGHLFKRHKPLFAYSVEIAGSIAGIVLFSILSVLQLPVSIWLIIGFLLLFLIIDWRPLSLTIALACSLLMLSMVHPFSSKFIWSPYYRIYFEPITQVQDKQTEEIVNFENNIGYTLTVNNDYHQMLLDLRKRDKEHDFLSSWRNLYDYPYKDIQSLPEGPILIVGSGTGNDIAAALRNTNRKIFAVEIDPAIIELGRKYNTQKVYSDSRVTVINDDARSFFQQTKQKFALVVFGYLDSHTLMSSFSSLRLDNFVYTKESFQQVKKIMLEGGKVSLTFCTLSNWIDKRITKMLDEVFDSKTSIVSEKQGVLKNPYTNGKIYNNFKNQNLAANKPINTYSVHNSTDDWPFLYLRKPTIPAHYLFFISLVLMLGCASFFILPKNERQINFPYFFLGAGFFLMETSNVVSLSLLFGSTWYVNVLVFVGILLLVLLGNLTSALIKKPKLGLYFILLFASLAIAYFSPRETILTIESIFSRALVAIPIFLGPIFFASLVFATLIKKEKKLYQAYGSNILGAVFGGCAEYLSMVYGFSFLLILTAVIYLLVYFFLKSSLIAKRIQIA